jgi:hypothetical protein
MAGGRRLRGRGGRRRELRADRSGYITGFDWLDADSGTGHFGIDLHSATGNSAITSYDDEVVDTDVCTACTRPMPKGNTLGEFDLDYNYGYGDDGGRVAYEDLSEEQRNNLTAEGGVGERSLYLMMGHWIRPDHLR